MRIFTLFVFALGSSLYSTPYTFKITQWNNGLWIFCNDEPIAEVRLESAELLHMKLVPGGPSQLKASLAWLEAKQTSPLPVTLTRSTNAREGQELRLEFEGRTAFPKARNYNHLRIYFDEAYQSFAYEFEGGSYLEKGWDTIHKHLKSIGYNYLYPIYSSPQANEYPWEIFFSPSGKLLRSPIRTDWDENPRSHSLRPYDYLTKEPLSQKDGHFLVRGTHPKSNPMVFFLHGVNQNRSSVETCAYSHETHLGWAPTPGQQIYKAHYRYVGLSPEKMKHLLERTEPYAPTRVRNMRIVPRSGRNGFNQDQQVPNDSALFDQAAPGTYQVTPRPSDPTNSVLLLTNHDWIRFVSPSEKTRWNRIQFEVLFEKKEAGEQLLLHSFQGEYHERLVIRPPHRKWSLVSLPLRFSQGKHRSSFEVYYEGSGKVWMDNLEFREDTLNELLKNPLTHWREALNPLYSSLFR